MCVKKWRKLKKKFGKNDSAYLAQQEIPQEFHIRTTHRYSSLGNKLMFPPPPSNSDQRGQTIFLFREHLASLEGSGGVLLKRYTLLDMQGHFFKTSFSSFATFLRTQNYCQTHDLTVYFFCILPILQLRVAAVFHILETKVNC